MTLYRIAWLSIFTAAGLLRADTVILNNTDHLSGEIQKLEGKHLYLKTAYAGVVEIDWSMVQAISSEHALQFSLQNGMTLTGTVRNAAGGMLVSSVSPDLPVLPYDVKAISKPVEEQSFRNRLDGSIELGLSVTRGNSLLNQSSVAATAAYHAEHLRVQTELSSMFSKQAPAQSTGTHSLSTRLDYYVTPVAFAFTLGSLERDSRELLNLRSTAGGGMGWQMVHSHTAEVSLLGGLTLVHESNRGSEEANPDRHPSTGEGLFAVSLDRLQAGRLRFTGKASVYPSVLETSRVRLVLAAGVRMPVVAHVIWSLRLFERFDNRPVSAVQKHDYGIVSSFGFAF